MGESAWAVLSEGFRPSGRLAGAWLWGLGFNRGAPVDVLLSIFDTGRADFLYREDLPPGVLDAAVVHPAKRVRVTAVETRRLSPEQWVRVLAATADPKLRAVLAELEAEEAAYRRSGGRTGVQRAPGPESRPPVTPAEIAKMAATVPDIAPDHRTYALWWVAALHEDAEAMRQLAASPNLWIRRSVARATHLPPDVVDLLAHDGDRVVRLFLTESCDDAPADLLLDVWAWWPGSFSFPGRPRNHPNFPRHELLRFAEDPEARLRLLALDDPASSFDLVERFSRDPDPSVRRRAAEDVRLSPESAARLVKDPERGVCHSAWRNSALPAEVIVSLLVDERSAEEAARNPAIPASVMKYMIGLAAAQS